jgi:hypothetical protein
MSGKYIILFKKGTSKSIIDAEAAKVAAAGGIVGHRYEDTLLGFAATLPDDHVGTLVKSEHVDVIEGDGEVSAFARTLGIN